MDTVNSHLSASVCLLLMYRYIQQEIERETVRLVYIVQFYRVEQRLTALPNTVFKAYEGGFVRIFFRRRSETLWRPWSLSVLRLLYQHVNNPKTRASTFISSC